MGAKPSGRTGSVLSLVSSLRRPRPLYTVRSLEAAAASTCGEGTGVGRYGHGVL